MKVLLTSAYEDPEPIGSMKRFAAIDRVQEHQVVDSADDADVILFVENSHYADDFFFRRLLDHPILKQFPTKTLIYNEQDRPFHVIPGLYASMPRSRFDPHRQRACCLIKNVNEYFDHSPGTKLVHESDRLYSFVGRRYAGVRARLLSESHPRGLVRDTSDFNPFQSSRMASQESDQKRRYLEAMVRSKFALCPRGVGTSTYRVYEAMSIGRAPVVLADEWVPPSGPDWSAFAVFIPESDAHMVQSILERYEDSWAERGEAAKAAWEQWFAPDVRFHRFANLCQQVLAESKGDPTFFKPMMSKHYFYMRVRVAADRAVRFARR